MKVTWEFEDHDVEALQHVVSERAERTFVRVRRQRNVDGDLPEITRDLMWWTQIMCLLTTQQRSGPGSAVGRFLGQNPFPLDLSVCEDRVDLREYALATLSQFGGLRFAPKLSRYIETNLRTLSAGEWARVEAYADALTEQRQRPPEPSNFALEREAADYLQQTLLGFGPKQARNFWQYLGLQRYEFVLDSRILRWINRNLDMPFPMSTSSLGNVEYYHFVSDIMRRLCVEANLVPCVVDAAIFDSYDEEDWREEDI